MILADESNISASPTEIDSKTIMTAMTIRSISMNIKICAELLDMKFEKYLSNTHVDEIIFTNEYSKSLIANSFARVGVAKVVNELLDTHTTAYISTEKIPNELIGKSFSDLKAHLRTTKNYLTIGILENVGSYLERKNEALREAQKTADISKLILNLKHAKRMENNLPCINPDDNYVIPQHSMAIIIGNKRN